MSDAAVASPEQIETLIVDYIRRELVDPGDDDIDIDENLFVSGRIDSVGFMRLITHLSEALGVTVPAPELVPDNFRTIRVMAGYLGSLPRDSSSD